MKLTLHTKEPLGGTAWRFTFMPEQPLSWQAGQFMRVSLPHPEPDAGGILRQFTIAAAPHEQNLAIATRLRRSSFKRALGQLPLGGQLDLVDTPAGDFVWQAAAKPHIFVAQGIGITPFYAIIKDRIYRGLPVAATLIYASQPGAAIIFERELKGWMDADPSLTLERFSGTITSRDIIDLAPDYAGRLLYVSGPKSFISLCIPPYQLPINHLKQDNFPGYSAADY